MAAYFSGVMVRLMLTLTPVMCILSAIAVSVTIERIFEEEPDQVEPDQVEQIKEPVSVPEQDQDLEKTNNESQSETEVSDKEESANIEEKKESDTKDIKINYKNTPLLIKGGALLAGLPI